MTTGEEKLKLYKTQKRTLDLFLERHAISQDQYDKSLADLTTKMGIGEVTDIVFDDAQQHEGLED